MLNEKAIPITTAFYFCLGDPSLRACGASTIQDDGNGGASLSLSLSPSTIRHPELLTALAVGVMKDPPEQRNKPIVFEKPKSQPRTRNAIKLPMLNAKAIPITTAFYFCLGDPSLRACGASTIQDDGNGGASLSLSLYDPSS